ncbi:MAG TPA: ABC transporter permease [candidate division Zixibacteria bacterium]|nr:ABC transporter permease [candidate division Zixibacteria bacterium]
MASAQILHPVTEDGWRAGLPNLVRKENDQWWHTRRWWIQSLLWLAIINGTLAIGLWVMPVVDPDLRLEVALAYEFFVQMMVWFPMFAVIVIAQGAIVSEKKSGTAAWVLSTPVSRESFILSKLLANALGFLVTVVVLQGAVAYIQLSLYGEALLPIGPFLAVLGLFSLYLLFYLALTLMLGTFFEARGPVLGIAIGIAIASMRGLGQLFSGYAPWLVKILPEALPVQANAIASGTSLRADWPIPIILISLYSVSFMILAIWRFKHEEF